MQQKRKPQLSRRVFLQSVLYRHEILQRLWHLAAGYCQVARMQEISHPMRIVEVRFGLSKLIIVMGKFEIHTTRMNVQALSANNRCHNRAFDVPSRTSLAPRAIPPGLTRLRALPKCEICHGSFLREFIFCNTQVACPNKWENNIRKWQWIKVQRISQLKSSDLPSPSCKLDVSPYASGTSLA